VSAYVACRNKSWHWRNSWVFEQDKWRCGSRTEGQGGFFISLIFVCFMWSFSREKWNLIEYFFFRTKLKQTEVDCEFLKRCCENLTEENRRLQKEVQELRALKLSPQFYMHMTPPTTLTMCPSCERVAVPPSSAVDAATRHHHVAQTHSRAFPVGPWATSAGPISHRPFDALRPRS